MLTRCQSLRLNFGLDAIIVHHELDVLTRRFIEICDPRSWPCKVTISYLTLPSTLANFSTRADDGIFPEDQDPEYIHTALVDFNSLVLTNHHKRRFARAMRFLALEVSSQRSQLTTKLEAFSPSYNFNNEHKGRSSDYDRDPHQHELQRVDESFKGQSSDDHEHQGK